MRDIYVTRATLREARKIVKCVSRSIEGRHRERIESVSFPRNHPERKREETKWRVLILPNAHGDVTRIYTKHTHMDIQSTWTYKERSKKKETIDYSTK